MNRIHSFIPLSIFCLALLPVMSSAVSFRSSASANIGATATVVEPIGFVWRQTDPNAVGFDSEAFSDKTQTIFIRQTSGTCILLVQDIYGNRTCVYPALETMQYSESSFSTETPLYPILSRLRRPPADDSSGSFTVTLIHTEN